MDAEKRLRRVLRRFQSALARYSRLTGGGVDYRQAKDDNVSANAAYRLGRMYIRLRQARNGHSVDFNELRLLSLGVEA